MVPRVDHAISRARMKLLPLCVTLAIMACHRGSDARARKPPPAPGERSGVAGTAQNSHANASSATSGSCGPKQEHPSQDTSWTKGLTAGANGPIPVMVVDQFGYRSQATKVAVIRDPRVGYDAAVDFEPGTHYAVVDAHTGAVVKKGSPLAWKNGGVDDSSGDRAWWFDFSDVNKAGTYSVQDLDKHARTVEFEINDSPYRGVLKQAVRMFFFQRVGFKKTAAVVGPEWADAASHLGPGQDGQAHAWTDKGNAKRVRDLRGGWFDAGDYNKYTSWAARAAIMLLRAFEETPAAFGDDFGIAESGNGAPDVLDEIEWGLRWLSRMQDADGSLYCVQGLASGSPPSAATGPSYYGPATTAATLSGAAAFAYASKIFAARPEANLKALGNELARRAKNAWAWAKANARVVYYNNDESRQPGSKGLASGQQEMDDTGRQLIKFEAATYLYELTREPEYKAYADANYGQILASSAPNQWNVDRYEALLRYAKLPGTPAAVKNTIVAQFVDGVLKNPDQFPMVVDNKDPYRAPIKDYSWGSNHSKAAQARIYQLFAAHAGNDALKAKAAAAAEEYVHYIHGVNPLGLVYLTNMRCYGAEHSARTQFHTWFADGSARWDETTDTAPGPAPGYLVGGPNPQFSLDSCCSAPLMTPAYRCYHSSEFALCGHDYAPPLKQPPQKAYLQFNSGWPANSWAITEPSIGYQAQYVRVLAQYVR